MSSNLYLENELGLILSYNETEKFTETIKEHFPDYISESPDVRNLIESESLLIKDAISLREVSKTETPQQTSLQISTVPEFTAAAL